MYNIFSTRRNEIYSKLDSLQENVELLFKENEELREIIKELYEFNRKQRKSEISSNS